MLEIFFIACSISRPGLCSEKSISYSDLTELTCISRSEMEIAQWKVLHPGWSIERWGCRRAGLMSKA